MRISSTMMSNNYLKQLNGTYEQYSKLMEQADGIVLQMMQWDIPNICVIRTIRLVMSSIRAMLALRLAG